MRTPPPFPLAALIAAGAVAGAGLFLISGDPRIDVSAFFGPLPSAIGFLLVAVFGIGALYVLQTRFGFVVWRDAEWRRFVVAALWAVPFMGIITFYDLINPLPADINVPVPLALAYYPAMGLVAQWALHIIPFVLLLLVLSPFQTDANVEALVLMAIVVTSLLEAGFQISGNVTGVAAIALAVHIFLFGCAELLIFRRYDFATMYVFRLTYYAWWHVVST